MNAFEIYALTATQRLEKLRIKYTRIIEENERRLKKKTKYSELRSLNLARGREVQQGEEVRNPRKGTRKLKRASEK